MPLRRLAMIRPNRSQSKSLLAGYRLKLECSLIDGARWFAPVFRPSLDVATCPNCGRLSRMVFQHLGLLVCLRCYDRVGRPN